MLRASIARFGRFYSQWHPSDPESPRVLAPEDVEIAEPIEPLSADDFIKSPRWKKLRRKVLRERGAKCEFCGATRPDGVVIQVDHIKPRKLYPELAWEESNLQVLCKPCNQVKSAHDRWQEKIELRAIPKQFRYLR